MRNVAIVILAYNSATKNRELYKKCLLSSLEQDYPYKQVIVIDNGSTDNTYDFSKSICKERNECKVVRLPRNFGWAGGNNRGAILAKESKYILFLNDDAYFIHSDCVSKLVEYMERDPMLGAVQPVIINRDGSLNLGGVLGFSGFSVLRTSIRYNLSYLSGATLMVRASTFFKVGMFDEKLFLYYDDVDFSLRLLAHGWRIAIVPNCLVFHWESATVGKESPIYLYYTIRNNLLVLAKNSSLGLLPIKIALAILGSLNIVGHWILVRRDAEKLKYVIKGLIDGLAELGSMIIKNKRKIRGFEDPHIDLGFLCPRTIRSVLKQKLFPHRHSAQH
jgi:GT2 family glycosyltransferase